MVYSINKITTIVQIQYSLTFNILYPVSAETLSNMINSISTDLYVLDTAMFADLPEEAPRSVGLSLEPAENFLLFWNKLTIKS